MKITNINDANNFTITLVQLLRSDNSTIRIASVIIVFFNFEECS